MKLKAIYDEVEQRVIEKVDAKMLEYYIKKYGYDDNRMITLYRDALDIAIEALSESESTK